MVLYQYWPFSHLNILFERLIDLEEFALAINLYRSVSIMRPSICSTDLVNLFGVEFLYGETGRKLILIPLLKSLRVVIDPPRVLAASQDSL